MLEVICVGLFALGIALILWGLDGAEHEAMGATDLERRVRGLR